MKKHPPLSSLLLLAPWTTAYLLPPAQTTAPTPLRAALAPFPTNGPQPDHVLLRRQADSDTSYTLLEGTGKTCGYLSGFPGAGLTCSGTSTCMFSPDVGIRMCCGAECEGFLDCTNAADVDDPFFCDDICHQNQFMLKCKSSAPFCRTLVYPGSITDFDCVTFSPTAIASADFTYTSWKGAFPFNTVTLEVNDGITSMIVSGTTDVIGGEGGRGGLFGSGTLPSFPPTDPPGPISTTDPGPTETPDPPEPNNVGAIVGGTIGGVAVVGLIVLAAVFLLRRGKPAASPPPPPVAQSSMGYPPSTANRASTAQSPVARSDVVSYLSNQASMSMMEDPNRAQSMMHMGPTPPPVGGNAQNGQYQAYAPQVFEADNGILGQQGVQPHGVQPQGMQGVQPGVQGVQGVQPQGAQGAQPDIMKGTWS